MAGESVTAVTNTAHAVNYHTWGLVVPLLAALAPLWLMRHAPAPSGIHPAAYALMFGLLVGGASYGGLSLLAEPSALSKAVLLGLLTAETLVLTAKPGLPTMATITLYLFFYYHTVEH
jgi:hypothetical protein